MRLRMAAVLSLFVAAACGSTPAKQGEESRAPAPSHSADLTIHRDADTLTFDRKLTRPTKKEEQDFAALWELFRKRSPKWPIERDRFERRSDGAAALLAACMLRYYFQVNAVRDRARPELERAKSEIVAIGEPCAPFLVDLLVLDRIRLPGKHDAKARYFLPDDLTRRDCLEMLSEMRGAAVPDLLRVLQRKDLSPKGRRMAALALGGTRDPRAFDRLVALLLHDPSWEVRADAATALAELGDRRALRPLETAIAKDRDPAVVRRAGKAKLKLLGRK